MKLEVSEEPLRMVRTAMPPGAHSSLCTRFALLSGTHDTHRTRVGWVAPARGRRSLAWFLAHRAAVTACRRAVPLSLRQRLR